MQYPIIDLINEVYINNEWTGLHIIEGKNLLSNDKNLWGPYGTDNTGYVPVTPPIRFSPYLIELNVNPNEQYTLSIQNNTSGAVFWFGINIYGSEGTRMYDSGWRQNSFSFTCPDDSVILRIPFRLDNNGDITAYLATLGTDFNIQLERGLNKTSYEPYQIPVTDIERHLKLPLPHYFPQPVIESLQRTAAGTQTADDVEILRHYLTPLGIGGI